VSQKTISRFERGDSLPSMPQVAAWARATSAGADRLTVLTGLLEAAVNEVATFRDKLADGLVAVQLEVRELEASAGTVRNFQTGIIPGLLQTADYARHVLDMANINDDTNIAAAVAARLERQQALHDKSRRFEFLMTEAALRWRPGPPELLAAQLDHVAALATLDTIELGVIPMDAEMHAITRCSFIVYEDRTDGRPPVVAVETPHASLYASDAADVELYRDQLALFRQSAIYGAEALDFIRAIAHPAALIHAAAEMSAPALPWCTREVSPVNERVLINCVGLGRSIGGGWPVGAYLASYDPGGNDGQGDAVWTRDPAQAMVFGSAAEALERYRAVPANRPVRVDGKPNRPLTALAIELVPVPDQELVKPSPATKTLAEDFRRMGLY
jgi:hypothetical protein